MQGHFQKNLRRTVMRYVNLSTILVYRLVSKKVTFIYLGRDTVLIESEFLPVTNLTLSLLSVSPDTFVRQRMKWNFNDHFPKNLLSQCLSSRCQTGSPTSTPLWRPSCCFLTRLRGCRGSTSELPTRPPGPPSSGPSSSCAKQGGKKIKQIYKLTY